LAARGLYVFPAFVSLRPDGKKLVRPCADWDKASTTDPDRIAVMFEGRIMGILPIAEASVARIGLMMSGTDEVAA
jgi:simple sugar transport system ATP-binding protein